jgi:S-DNA-T family DNA segregation ATPase FtsK/SpoIIIE
MSPLLQRTLRADRAPAVSVRGPIFRLSLLVVVVLWLMRCAGRLLVAALRHPRTTIGSVALYALLLTARAYGVGTVLLPALGLCSALAGWAWAAPATFERFVARHGRSWWRRVWTYRREWQPAMLTAGLSLPTAQGALLPELRSVRSTREVDVVRVRMNPGQTVIDWTSAAPRLAQTFGLLDCRPRSVPGNEHALDLWCLRADPLLQPVPVPEPGHDPLAVPVGRREDGQPFALRVLYSHLLIAGETGAGKGSVIWSLLCGMAPGIRDGLVRVWAIDPKGGLELAAGASLFDKFVYGGPTTNGAQWQEPIADLLEVAVRGMQARAARLRGTTRKLTPSVDDPLIVIVVDEVASLTAYVTDPALRARIAAALSLLLSQGRAVGVTVVAATQDARKEVLSMRDLFPTRIGLRTAEPGQADMILGQGARARGARTEQISEVTPGVGYVVLDDAPEPVRVRFAYVTDEHIAGVVEQYRPLVHSVTHTL